PRSWSKSRGRKFCGGWPRSISGRRMQLLRSTFRRRRRGGNGRNSGLGIRVAGKVPAIGFHNYLGIVETRLLVLNADPVFQDRALSVFDEIEGLETQIARNLSEAVQALLCENFDALIIEGESAIAI